MLWASASRTNAAVALALDIDRRVRFGLRDFEQLLAGKLEDGEEGHDQPRQSTRPRTES